MNNHSFPNPSWAVLGLAFLAFAAVFLAWPRVGLAGTKYYSQGGQYIQTAMANNSVLANNKAAQTAYLGIINVESGFDPGNNGNGVSYNGSSFGIGQVNYFAHQKEIQQLMIQNGGPNIAGMSYNQAKALAGQFLINNPQLNANIGASIFSGYLQSCKGDVSCAVTRYCGGCDPNYVAKVQAAIAQNAAAGIAPGDVVLSSNTTVTRDANGNMVVNNTTTTVKVVDCGPNATLGGFQQDMESARAGYLAKVLGKMGNAYPGATFGKGAAQRDSDGEIELGENYCINIMFDFYDVINALRRATAGGLLKAVAAALGAMIDAIINQLIDMVCNWITNAIATVINNALAMICLPLPNLGLGYGLPSLPRKYCNGLSPGMLFHATPQTYGPSSLNFNPASAIRGAVSSTLQQMPTGRIGNGLGGRPNVSTQGFIQNMFTPKPATTPQPQGGQP